ncbi:MAG: mechanosensitive ion channel family protein [Mariniblastus sp.]|nr:mechanosensitive ion channel family protein [Mariniblastus sp.]
MFQTKDALDVKKTSPSKDAVTGGEQAGADQAGADQAGELFNHETFLRENFASDQMTQALDWLEKVSQGWGLNPTLASMFAVATAVIGVLLICGIADFIAKLVIQRIMHRSLRKSSSVWASELINQKVLERLSHFVPIVLLALSLPAFQVYGIDWWLRPLLELAAIWVLVRMIWGVIEVGERTLVAKGFGNKMPLVGMSQAAKMIVLLIGILLALSALFAKSPLWFISGLGAMMAVLLLIFKDAILGLVAGVQIAANQMVRVGDWITVPSKGVDGDVEEITLTTVQVRAFDQTLMLIPAYDLINTPFQNWRGMSESGARRIKRSISIDINSIRFVDEQDVERYRKFSLIDDYLDQAKQEIGKWNESHGIDTTNVGNGRQQTNVGIYRAYIKAYLHDHPKIYSDKFTFLVRQLAPGPDGLPIELYVFTNDNRWVQYEEIQADIFDHLLASAAHFDLEVYQSPSGSDVRALKV